MNYDKETKNVFTKTLYRIKRWPIEKKRLFSVSLALFLTILIIILNFSLNLIWKSNTSKINYAQNDAIDSFQKSFSQIYDKAKPALDQIFSSSTYDLPVQTGEIIDQINSTSSSFSTTTNMVE